MEQLTLSELVELKSKLMKPEILATPVELEAIKNVEDAISSFPNVITRKPLESDICTCVFCEHFKHQPVIKEEAFCEITDEEKSAIIKEIEIEELLSTMTEEERFFFDLETDRDFEPDSEVQFSE